VRVLTRPLLFRAVDELCARDADLARVVTQYGPPPMWARRPGFATLVRIILEQQVSLSSADAAYRRLRAGVGRVLAARVASFSPRQIRRLGITRQKAGFIRDLARAATNGGLPLRQLADLSDAAVRGALLQVRGIGPWTADIYLIMALRRADVWPDGDLALVKALATVKRRRPHPKPEAVRRVTARWAPWRAVAARILWHTYLSEQRHGRSSR
jgi:DNA-3-methyladenine glycosylase II